MYVASSEPVTVTVSVSKFGSVSAAPFPAALNASFSNLNLRLTSSLTAEPVNVTVPPLGKLNGYRSVFSLANPAHASAPAG